MDTDYIRLPSVHFWLTYLQSIWSHFSNFSNSFCPTQLFQPSVRIHEFRFQAFYYSPFPSLQLLHSELVEWYLKQDTALYQTSQWSGAKFFFIWPMALCLYVIVWCELLSCSFKNITFCHSFKFKLILTDWLIDRLIDWLITGMQLISILHNLLLPQIILTSFWIEIQKYTPKNI